jgi:D-arabinose 1-dehydrogenase-like Zn-dependent alcohol dehydrogenase
MIERYPLSRVEEAFDRMIAGKGRFRAVLTI